MIETCFMESNTRSFAKTISYRVFGSLATAGIVFFYSGDWKASTGAALIDSVVKLGLYFIHERIWDRIPIGRPKPPEYEI